MVGKLLRLSGLGNWCVLTICLSGLPAEAAKNVWIFDWDLTVANLGYYRIFKKQYPGFPGLGAVAAGEPEMIRVSVLEYESLARKVTVGKKLARRDTGPFESGAYMKEYTTAEGVTFIPGHYYFDEERSLEEFYPKAGVEEEGYLYEHLVESLKTNRKFLLEGAAFLRIALENPAITPVFDTYRGTGLKEWKASIKRLAASLGWEKADVDKLIVFSHSDPEDFARYGNKKSKIYHLFWNDLRRHKTDPSDPHRIVYFENAQSHLTDLNAMMTNTSGTKLGPYRVVPSLVNLSEETIFRNPRGIDWSQTGLQTISGIYRVQTYTGQHVPLASNNITSILEVALGLTAKEAAALYKDAFPHEYACRNLADGRKKFLPGETLPGFEDPK
jgi:hypothetical protein